MSIAMRRFAPIIVVAVYAFLALLGAGAALIGVAGLALVVAAFVYVEDIARHYPNLRRRRTP